MLNFKTSKRRAKRRYAKNTQSNQNMTDSQLRPTLDQKAEEEFEKIMEKVLDKGFKDGKSIDTELSAWNFAYSKISNSQTNGLKKELGATEIRLNSLKEKINLGVNHIIEDKRKEFIEEAAIPMGVIEEAYFKADEQLHNIDKELRQIEKKLRNSNGPLKKTNWDKNWVAVSNKVLISTIETVSLIPVAQLLGIDYLFLAGLFTFFFSQILIVFADGIAEHHDGQKSKYRAWCLVGFALLVLTVVMRIIAEADWWYITAPLIILLFLGSILLKIRKKRFKPHFDLLDRKSELAKLKEQKLKVMVEEDAKGKTIVAGIENNAKQEGEKIFENMKLEKNELEIQIQSLKIEIPETIEYLKFFKQQKDAELLNAFQEAKDDVYHKNDDRKKNTPIWKSVFSSFMLFVLFLSCSENTRIAKGAVFMDKSSSIEIPNYPTKEALSNFICSDLLNLEDLPVEGLTCETQYGYIDGSIMPITLSTPELYIPHIAKRNLSKVDKDIDSFTEDVNQKISSLYKSDSDANQTNIIFPVSHILNSMTKDGEADLKFLILLTDGIQEIPYGINFTDYSRDPSKLISNFDEISQELTKDITLDNLSGIQILMIYPDNGASTLAHYTRLFWKRFFTSYGATFDSRASL